MGPDKDVDLFGKYFQVTGSDNSRIFLDIYRKRNPDADLILLDATTLDTKRKFECLYSNKVLYHLSKLQLKKSFQNQANLLKTSGYLFHTFWYGVFEENHSELQMVYYTQETLDELIGEDFETIEFQMYTEMDENDSFYILLRKN